MRMIRRIMALIVKEFLAVLKDPKSRFVLIGPPIIQFFVFGYTATFEVRDVEYALVDESRTTESRAFAARFASSDAFRLKHEVRSAREASDLLDREQVRLIIDISPSFARDLQSGQPARVQVIADGRNSNVALIATGYVQEIVESYNTELAGGVGTSLVERAWYNPNFSSRWYILSCLGGVIVTVIVTQLTSLSVAREREFGTFDQLLVSPITPLGILIGKAVPPIVFGMFNATLLSVAAVLWFGVPFMGSIPAAALALLIYMMAITGVGLFISSLCSTMQQALLGSFVFMMPTVILSGFTTPIENMPGWLQTLTWINPLRWIVQALREIFLEGADLAGIHESIWPMLTIAIVTLSLAVWLFRHRTE